MKRPRVLFVSHVLDGSGAPRSLLHLLEHFPGREKFEFRVLGLRRTDLVEEFGAVAEKVEVITPSPPGSLPAKGFERLRSLPRLFSRLREARPDLVFVNSAANSRVILLSRLLGYRVWVFVHEFDDGFVFLPKLRRKALRLAEKVFVTNRLQLRWLREEVGYSGPVRIVPNIVVAPSQRVPPPRVFLDFRGRFPFLAATMGFFSRIKGWDLLLRIAETLRGDPGVGFAMIGDFPREDEKEAFLQGLKGRGLAERFFFTGLVKSVWPYLSAADCVLITSRSETFSRVALEAMSCGVPVVAFEVGSLREVFPPGYPFLVPPFDCKLFAAKILEVRNLSREELSSMRAAFAGHVRRFSPERVAPLFAKEFEELL